MHRFIPASIPRAALVTELAQLRSGIRAQKLGEVATEFDNIHSIQRAVKVGSVDAVITARELRPRLAEAIEHGLNPLPKGDPPLGERAASTGKAADHGSMKG